MDSPFLGSLQYSYIGNGEGLLVQPLACHLFIPSLIPSFIHLIYYYIKYYIIYSGLEWLLVFLVLLSLSLSLHVIGFSSAWTSRLGSGKVCVIWHQTLEAFQTTHHLTHAVPPTLRFSSAPNTYLSQICQQQQ